MDRLQEILRTMDIPESRRLDLFWLKRNMGIRNLKHPCLKEAMGLVSKNINTCTEYCIDYDGGMR